MRPRLGDQSRGERSSPVSQVYAWGIDRRLRSMVRGLGGSGQRLGGPGRISLLGAAVIGSGPEEFGQQVPARASLTQRLRAPAWLWGAVVCERGVTSVCAGGAEGNSRASWVCSAGSEPEVGPGTNHHSPATPVWGRHSSMGTRPVLRPDCARGRGGGGAGNVKRGHSPEFSRPLLSF